MSNIIEEWRDIEGYENVYQISNLGRVKSLPRIIMRNNGNSMDIKSRIKNICISVTGYPSVNLTVNNKNVVRKIHILIAKAFIPNPDNLPYVCHKNDIKTDNSLDNLYWGTPKDNVKDCIENGNRIDSNILNIEDVKEIRVLLNSKTQAEIARIFKVSDSTIRDIKTGRTWKNI
jgi:hypothetical protein